MSAGSYDKHNNAFFSEDEPELQPEAIQILTQYSGVNEGSVNKHVKAIREKAWKKHPYPCIGLYKFVDFGIGNTEQYSAVLTRVKNGESLLDVGCCFGHAIRKMVCDGAPAENLSGLEMEQDFIDLGFELFKDRETLQSHLFVGDIFEPKVAGLQNHSFNIIHAGAFIHLFTWTEQEEILRNIVLLLKPQAGSMIFGRQSGADVAGKKELKFARSGEVYRQNPSSFRELVMQVAKSLNMKLEVTVDPLGTVAGLKEDGSNWKLLSFCIVITDV